eukprot:TRINITY_DN48467_c0_g1_i1.p1 TRINITY_DN48467_c0_g1~~TRINITY_DN48467_c0_g1_i1.p1  ORF type:complete len:531 (+),score=99.89 TRINITY_DN48467_c0_g1_i1:97-1689(+)
MPRDRSSRRGSSTFVSVLSGVASGWEMFWGWCRGSSTPLSMLHQYERLEVVYSGGAVMRSGFELTSDEVAVVHRGEAVLLLDEVGRRARIRTRDGYTGWISLYTADNVPIVRRVLREEAGSKRSKAAAEAQQSRPAFKEDFERKWQKLRVDTGPPEARIHSLRQSSGSMPIRQWRPTGLPSAPVAQKRETDLPVPRLNPPSSSDPSASVERSEVSSSSGSHAARPGEDLLDFSDAGSLSQRLPPLSEVLAAAVEGRSVFNTKDSYFSSDEGTHAGSKVGHIPEAPPSRRESMDSERSFYRQPQGAPSKQASEAAGNQFPKGVDEDDLFNSQLPNFEHLLDQDLNEDEAGEEASVATGEDMHFRHRNYDMEDEAVLEEEEEVKESPRPKEKTSFQLLDDQMSPHELFEATTPDREHNRLPIFSYPLQSSPGSGEGPVADLSDVNVDVPPVELLGQLLDDRPKGTVLTPSVDDSAPVAAMADLLDIAQPPSAPVIMPSTAEPGDVPFVESSEGAAITAACEEAERTVPQTTG